MKKRIIFDLDGVLFDPHILKGPYPDVLPVLSSLSLDKDIDINLLTVGRNEIQLDKLRRCGVGDYFDRVIVVEKDEEKRRSLTILFSDHIKCSHHVVIGDRIDVEIRYAIEMEYTSIRVKRGKYAYMKPCSSLETPMYTITSLLELSSILEKL